jgi:hypothetical protein
VETRVKVEYYGIETLGPIHALGFFEEKICGD